MNDQDDESLSARVIEDRQMAATVSARSGIQIESIYDLVNTRQRYPQAIPILIDFLPVASDPAVREGS